MTSYLVKPPMMWLPSADDSAEMQDAHRVVKAIIARLGELQSEFDNRLPTHVVVMALEIILGNLIARTEDPQAALSLTGATIASTVEMVWSQEPDGTMQ
jgi:hypothetical protein